MATSKANSGMRWGIIAPGVIAEKFAAAMQSVPEGNIRAVASRNPDRAKSFAQRFSIPEISGSYEELCQRDDIDAIYIASPHVFHCEQGIMALDGKKSVLIEKPICIRADECQQLKEHWEDSGSFLMEAMWTRFLPSVDEAASRVRDGEIGQVLRIEADFSFDMPKPAEHRLNNPQLGGGAVYDVGVYVLHAARLFSGMWPEHVGGTISTGPTGVDVFSTMVLAYPDGMQALLTCGIRCDGRRDIRVIGTKGVLTIPGSFHASTNAVMRNDRGERIISKPHRKNGFEYEIEAVQDAVRQGKREHNMMPVEDSFRIVGLMQQFLENAYRQSIDLRD